MMSTLHVGGLDFEVRLSDRRKTLSVTVDRNGDLIAHAPADTSGDELSNWIRSKLLWVHRKLALKDRDVAIRRSPEYVSGESFPYLGHRYRLRVVARQEQPLAFDGTKFILRRNALPTERHFRQWYISTGTGWLKRRVAAIAARTGTIPRRVEVRDLGYRWGSCGRNGVLYFNWKLFQLPVRLVDYVVAHELVHLREGHHGLSFWAALDRAMPDWEDRKSALEKVAKEYLVFGLLELEHSPTKGANSINN